jgi:hypothetical protein
MAEKRHPPNCSRHRGNGICPAPLPRKAACSVPGKSDPFGLRRILDAKPPCATRASTQYGRRRNSKAGIFDAEQTFLGLFAIPARPVLPLRPFGEREDQSLSREERGRKKDRQRIPIPSGGTCATAVNGAVARLAGFPYATAMPAPLIPARSTS